MVCYIWVGLKDFCGSLMYLWDKHGGKKPSLYSSSTEKNLKWVTYTGNLVVMQRKTIRDKTLT